MSITDNPVMQPPPAALPADPGDLTLGQLIELFRIAGGAKARQWCAALRESAPASYRGTTAQDTCALVMLGLVRVDRGRVTATMLGVRTIDQVVDAMPPDAAPAIPTDAELWGADE